MEKFELLWLDAVSKAIADGPWEDPFDLHYGELRLEQAAAVRDLDFLLCLFLLNFSKFFLVDDRSGAIGRIRGLLKRVSDELVKANPDFPSIRLPEIVHTTFLRYESAPSLSQDEIRIRFEKLKSLWKDPISVRCDKMVCVREIRPYLHQEDQKLGEFQYKRV